MALIVENGSGVSGAESYVSVEVFIQYMIRRGLAAPTGASEADLEGALVRASEAIDALYGSSWLGVRVSPVQGLDWPRSGVYIERTLLAPQPLPKALIHAVCEAAWREASAPGSMVPDLDTTGRVTSETVGPLSVSYAEPSPAEAAAAGSGSAFTSISKLLARLTAGQGSAGTTAYLLRA